MSDTSRRKLLKSIAAGTGTVIAGKSLPESWSRPVVDSVILPAHAQTSTDVTYIATYPTTAAVTDTGGSASTVGATEGNDTFFQTGDYMEETITTTGICNLSSLNLSITMWDDTDTCAVGDSHTFNVVINGVPVGAYQFITPPGGDAGNINVGGIYSFGAIAGQGGGGDEYTIRIVATSTVCPGGNAWSWNSGGSATLAGVPC